MWIIQLALRQRYTLGALVLLLALVGARSVSKMSTDILPSIDIPYVNVLWTYPGLAASDMASKISSFSEIAIMNNVDDVKGISSDSGNGYALIQVQFHQNAKLDVALSQITSVSQTILKRLPQGMTPPLVVNYSTSSVPVLQLAISSETISESQLYDYARLALRRQIQSIPGLRLSLPYGGTSRQLMIDLNMDEMRATGVTAKDVARALSQQNVTLPSGEITTGTKRLTVSTNASPADLKSFASIPIKSTGHSVIQLGDVAEVRDGGAEQTSMAKLDGKPGVMVSVLKLGKASTVDIIDEINKRLPQIRQNAPEDLRIVPVFDQSSFVVAARNTVVHEAILVAFLVAGVVLLFLGSAKSTAIVLTSIPLALLGAITGLSFAGYTFNLMTLGGLGLAIGILVDNALVEVENINRNIEMGKPVRQAVLDSAKQVVFPELVSTLSICIVLLPIFTLEGASAYVFRPLAMAVLLSMVASFILSRTLVPTLAFMMLDTTRQSRVHSHTLIHKVHAVVERLTGKLVKRHVKNVTVLIKKRGLVILLSLIASAVMFGTSYSMIGQNYFPESDAGGIRIFIRTKSGSSLEFTSKKFDEVRHIVTEVIPSEELQAVAENIGPPDPINRTWVPSILSMPSEGEMFIQLASKHAPTKTYIRKLRQRFADEFPSLDILFRPADIIAQTLNGTARAAIEINLTGRDIKGNLKAARDIMQDLEGIPGAVDLTLGQIAAWPDVYLEVDKIRAHQLGVDISKINQAILVTLSSSATVYPNSWANNGISYIVAAQVPSAQFDSLEELLNIPVDYDTSGNPVLLRNFVEIKRRHRPSNIRRQMLAPVVSVLVNVDGRDLGGVYKDVKAVLAKYKTQIPSQTRVITKGQAGDMENAYETLSVGMIMAGVLVYLLMVTNFQSWALPLMALGAMPFSITGAFVALWTTDTSLSVSAFMGMIMVMGVTTANSVLVVSFSRYAMLEGHSSIHSALKAISSRMRPVLMTAIAMLVGMFPMALAIGAGAEQNAPLARAVIGGLLFGTPATLTIVPLLISMRRKRLFRDNEDKNYASQ
ncbi:efflux RND transporter permease subunit [Paraglaciecola chathamensis]|jgi:multidrug efflux pump subunit AcrB|uniref:RND transporter n=1 Tax=Paraglaciecola chathamensis TaxID=368405 RepID=A0A8H9IEJ8_9ALTE|nr:efflux RND transporter permease subunit [Paraglaciecola oceanifecundans]GGZ79994.1 RND transporter [Paraglaciecola oceanifecundans]|tara:strand:- start:10624 stop:13779 length:3156 start_codon:yes stop_codon:yes gene_type:complete